MKSREIIFTTILSVLVYFAFSLPLVLRLTLREAGTSRISCGPSCGPWKTSKGRNFFSQADGHRQQRKPFGKTVTGSLEFHPATPSC